MVFFRKIGGFFLDIVETFVIALAIFVLMYLFLFQPHQVRGNSMYPNFQDQEYLLTDKITYQLSEPKRGDVIVFKAPGNEEYDYIKRIAGLPGDSIKVEDCHILVNGQTLTEDYLPENLCTSTGHFWQSGQSITLDENQYFVAGDNRPYSSDSRDWGTVPEKNIVGKVWLRYWPVDKIGIIRGPEY
ncbi:signal peptidase I [Microgenomates group bacterium RBG_19FT_COMBO_39_10]|nr:MAG: signal peptidase I [Microgenomates group bacterium RBG_19FT_COMBO_39_10]